MTEKVDTQHKRPALPDKGMTTEEKGTFIPIEKRVPYDRQNLFRSKAEFIAHQKALKEKELKKEELYRQYEADLKKKQEAIDKEPIKPQDETSAEPAATAEKPKRKSRPKKS